MKKADFCGVTDAVDCISEAIYATQAAIENDNIDLALSSINSAIEHAEYTLTRLTVICGRHNAYGNRALPINLRNELEWCRNNGNYGSRTGKLIEELYQYHTVPNVPYVVELDYAIEAP